MGKSFEEALQDAALFCMLTDIYAVISVVHTAL
jgi:hypothetical protein